jgi:hypothetical protein
VLAHHPDVLLIAYHRDGIDGILDVGQTPLLRFGNPLIRVVVPVEDNPLVGFDRLKNDGAGLFLDIARFFKPVREQQRLSATMVFST